MGNIYTKPILSLNLFKNEVKNDILKIYNDVRNISFSQLLCIRLIYKLREIGINEQQIDEMMIFELNFNELIKEFLEGRKRVLMIQNGEITIIKPYTVRTRTLRPSIDEAFISFTEILFDSIDLVITSVCRIPDNRFQLLTNEELRKYYPEAEYDDEEFEICAESIRKLATLFFDLLNKKNTPKS